MTGAESMQLRLSVARGETTRALGARLHAELERLYRVEAYVRGLDCECVVLVAVPSAGVEERRVPCDRCEALGGFDVPVLQEAV